jgi:Flp pilus assembly protein TadD
LEKESGQQSHADSRAHLVEQAGNCLRSGDYSRALDLLRNASKEFPNDAELSGLEKRAQDGIKRKTEADRLITESQELFAQQKSADAIQLLRQAYELDKNNSLARSILANALVEHASSLVETDWLGAETLTNQALNLNPAHPTAKTIRNLIVEKKKNSSADDWVAPARKLQSSGDLFAALAWVAEGLAVHPDDPKLLQLQDAIQRDQAARRRQARRSDLDDLRRIELEIDGASDLAAKQPLAERIQGLAAKHWTDGEILAVANRLLHRLGLAPRQNSAATPRSKSATVIFHVPRPTAPDPSAAETGKVSPPPAPPSSVPSVEVPVATARTVDVTPSAVVPNVAAPSIKPPSTAATRQVNVTSAPQRPEVQPLPTTSAASFPLPGKVATVSSQTKEPTGSRTKALLLIPTGAVIVLAAIFFFVRQHHAPIAAPPAATPSVSAPAVSAPTVTPAETTPAPPVPAASPTESPTTEKVAADNQPPAETRSSPKPSTIAESNTNLGTLVVVVGQDNAKVFLNGKLQRQLTQGGQLRIPNLELKDYAVQVSKSGYQDPPQQKARIRKGEEARLTFNLEPQPLPRLASLAIQGGTPGAAVLVDQTSVGTIQTDGTFSVSTVSPGDHTVELRKERFKPRQFKKHFVVGDAVTLAAADATLDALPGQLTITFAPADARVAIVKGNLLTMAKSGVPLNLGPGTYTLTARTADGYTSSTTLDVIAGQSRNLDLSLAPHGMANWDDASAWKHEKDSFIRKGGNFVLYGVVPTSGTFVFSAMPEKGRLLQWVLNYTNSDNYVLFQLDDSSFYRAVVRNGQKTDEVKIAEKGDKKHFRTIRIRVSPTEFVHQIKEGDSWTILDRWTQPGVNLSQGKFGFYIPGDDQVAISNFSHYGDLNIH